MAPSHSTREQLLTGRQVAERLNISASFAYALMRRAIIPTVRVGKRLRVRPEDLERYILERTAGPAASNRKST